MCVCVRVRVFYDVHICTHGFRMCLCVFICRRSQEKCAHIKQRQSTQNTTQTTHTHTRWQHTNTHKRHPQFHTSMNFGTSDRPASAFFLFFFVFHFCVFGYFVGFLLSWKVKQHWDSGQMPSSMQAPYRARGAHQAFKHVYTQTNIHTTERLTLRPTAVRKNCGQNCGGNANAIKTIANTTHTGTNTFMHSAAGRWFVGGLAARQFGGHGLRVFFVGPTVSSDAFCCWGCYRGANSLWLQNSLFLYGKTWPPSLFDSIFVGFCALLLLLVAEWERERVNKMRQRVLCIAQRALLTLTPKRF